MDYHGLVKRLQVPDGYIVPRELSYHDIRAHAISRADLDEDVRQSIARIKASPFIPNKDSVRGFVYEVETGKLREVS